jgi:hypothetical protein
MSANSLRATVEQLVDFSLLEFFLWGHLKTRVYYAPIKNEETLLQPIFATCHTIRNRPGTLESVLPSLFGRVHAYVASCGGHFHHLL